MLQGWRILLGVSGGIAAYKAVELVRRLRDAGAEVRVVMTENAARFVTALTFQAVSGYPVRSSLWDEMAEAAMGHIELARWAEVILIAPTSADTLAKLACGRADDLLSTLCLASAAPLILAPAMNQQMWAHPATQENLARLKARGTRFLGPESGSQACGDFGPGRLMEPEAIVAGLAASRGARLLEGIRVLVSAGPTYEDIDPVRFIGNRSSGRMGFAVAQAAASQGAEVTLVAGPVSLLTPPGVARRHDVRSSGEMHAAVMEHVKGNDIFIAAAAVSDYRPDAIAAHKLKKTADTLQINLNRSPDILTDVGALPNRPFLVGFAAETQSVEEYARAKLEAKKLDMIAANQVGDGIGFDAQVNALSVLWPGGAERLSTAPKLELAQGLVDLIARHYRVMAKNE